jgi:hypothetical protein
LAGNVRIRAREVRKGNPQNPQISPGVRFLTLELLNGLNLRG